ncbi:MAG: serine/threonine protein kinase [Elusimicrobia bacterium]|nr:serine/threonine protein kinase [Elusimicrobiota bacterium]
MADSLKADSAKNELQLGFFINNQYVTVKRIGTGGFGVVWQAYDFSLRNFIAIKELLPDYAQPKFVEMFYKEALIAKNIIHDNIVRVQHFWQGNNGSYYIVLDYIRGIDLEILISKCNDLNIKIPWKLATFICMSILKAIDYANRIARDSITGNAYGIVYRDISPGNVLLSFDGNIKLSDFGIAKTADELRDSIPEKVITGKYPYMSPEQIKGASNIDHRTDIFSVGVLYYEMLTGKQLYTGTNEEIKNKVLNERFDPAELNKVPEVPGEIVDVIAKSLEKNRDDRYEKAIEMYRDIRRVLKGVETDELSAELAEFIDNTMKEYVVGSEKFIENVKALDIQDVKKNEFVRKITCTDFIAGQAKNVSAYQDDNSSGAALAAGVAGVEEKTAVPKVEEKGKTVFEEVGDWLLTKINDIKKGIIRVIVSLILAVLIFAGLDIFLLQITPLGDEIYSRLYPPDVVITTVPAGAVVSMKTKEGEKILNNVSSSSPIPVRKVLPRSYIVSALKDGFKPVQRVVQIEKSDKGKKARKEKIEIVFDFVLNVDSFPRGASVYVDGNKFGVTPCKVQLMAGAHTVRLSMDGFDDLGSNSASVGVDGQCNIDFSKTAVEEMFAGVDRKFWDCELKNIDGENIFSVKGAMFKRVKIDSDPKGMMVHVQGEDQPRGTTPLDTLFKIGEYKIRLMDPNARFGEVLKSFVVSEKSDPTLFFKLNKIITFRVRSKEEPDATFLTTVSIYNKNFRIKKEISTTKPVKIPLPVDKYNVVFNGDEEYKSHTLYDVDISKTSTVLGVLEYANVGLNIKVKSSTTGNPLANVFVWQDKKILGKTDENGVFKSKFKPGSYSFRVIAKKYIEQAVNVDLISGRENTKEILLVPEVTEVKETKPVVQKTEPEPQLLGAITTSEEDDHSHDKASKEYKKIKDNDNGSGKEQQVVVCLNCGYVNTAPAGKKLRFCVNCAKPLK